MHPGLDGGPFLEPRSRSSWLIHWAEDGARIRHDSQGGRIAGKADEAAVISRRFSPLRGPIDPAHDNRADLDPHSHTVRIGAASGPGFR